MEQPPVHRTGLHKKSSIHWTNPHAGIRLKGLRQEDFAILKVNSVLKSLLSVFTIH